MLKQTQGTDEGLAIQNQWGFLKNIVNIDSFFSSGAGSSETSKESKKEKADDEDTDKKFKEKVDKEEAREAKSEKKIKKIIDDSESDEEEPMTFKSHFKDLKGDSAAQKLSKSHHQQN
jgi:hypothetical protein